MMPRLQAEERLSAITVTAAGTGTLERRDHREVISKLERIAGVVRQKVAKAGPAVLAAMGIAVVLPPPADKKVLSDG